MAVMGFLPKLKRGLVLAFGPFVHAKEFTDLPFYKTFPTQNLN